MSKNAITPPLKWHGGKHYLASKITALMPSHLHYVEPYAGGLAVLLAKDYEGVSEVVNDLNRELTNFWSVMREPSWRELYERLQFTAFDEWAYGEACDNVPRDEIMRAWSFFVRCRQSLAGRMGAFAPLSKTRVRRGMNEQASAWIGAVDGLPAVHARLRRVVVLNRPALDVIRQQDGKDTLFYLDPPYLHETRATTGEYAHEMTESDHNQLLTALAEVEGRFLLSGYRSNLYDEAATLCGWTRHDFDMPNNAASGDSKRRMVECVWCNF